MRRRSSMLCLALLLFGAGPAAGAELERFDEVTLAEAHDGDSFEVALDGERFHLRLYYVDCPETGAEMDSDARRLREQTRYWGLPESARTVRFGHEAKRFTRKALEAAPFTVHTAFAHAPGRSGEGRFYAFVTTAEGEDLATLLVKNGLARAHGVRRRTPEGVSRDEMIERLRDLELAAVLRRSGIWKETDAERIPGLRRKEREEASDMRALREALHPPAPPEEPLDPNTASLQVLQSIPGIGPVLAERIVAARPYTTWDSLREVEGIGPIRLEKIREFTLDPEAWEPGEAGSEGGDEGGEEGSG